MSKPTNHNKGYTFDRPKEVSFFGHSSKPGAPLEKRSFVAKSSQLAHPAYKANYDSLLVRHTEAIVKKKPFKFFRAKDAKGKRIPIKDAVKLNKAAKVAKNFLTNRRADTTNFLRGIRSQDIEDLLEEDRQREMNAGHNLSTMSGRGLKGLSSTKNIKNLLAKKSEKKTETYVPRQHSRAIEVLRLKFPTLPEKVLKAKAARQYRADYLKSARARRAIELAIQTVEQEAQPEEAFEMLEETLPQVVHNFNPKTHRTNRVKDISLRAKITKWKWNPL